MKRKLSTLSTLSTSLVATGCLITALAFLAPRAEANPGYNCGKAFNGCRSGAHLGIPGNCHWFWLGFKTYVSKRWACDGASGPLPNPPVECSELVVPGECCNLGADWDDCSDIVPSCPCTQHPGGPG